MKRNMAVVRTISAGAVGKCAKSYDSKKFDFSTERRHSSAGVRALLWSTASARSLGSSFGSDCHASKDNIYSNILTPDSIPQFTIPNLSVQTGLKFPEKDREWQREEDDGETDEGLGGLVMDTCSLTISPTSSLSSSSGLGSSPERKAHRCISEPLAHKCSARKGYSFPCPFMEARHCTDPTTRAALSLPHLAKVTTPYGFITLSQSPQMASEETLLSQAGLRRSHKDEDSIYYHSKAPGARTPVIPIKANAYRHPSTVQRLSRDYSISQTDAPREKIQTTTSASTSTSASLQHATVGKPKRRLWGVIRKHFTPQ